MLMASACGVALARRCIHASSLHAYALVYTMDEFAGACSAKKAIGSTFSRQMPSAPSTLNLYKAPSLTPSTNSTQTPEPGIRCMASPVHQLKSALSRTSRAFGAHTANRVPVTSPRSSSKTVTGWAPRRRQHSVSPPLWKPSRSQPVKPAEGSCAISIPNVGSGQCPGQFILDRFQGNVDPIRAGLCFIADLVERLVHDIGTQ